MVTNQMMSINSINLLIKSCMKQSHVIQKTLKIERKFMSLKTKLVIKTMLSRS